MSARSEGGTSQQTSTAPPDSTPETIELPRRLRVPRGTFEGDVAAVELRSRLAQAQTETLSPTVRRSAPKRHAANRRHLYFLVMAAVLAGAGGYLMATLPPSIVQSPANPSPVSASAGKSPRADAGEADVVAPPLTPETNPGLANRDSRMPAAQTAVVDRALADVRRAPVDAPPPASPAPDPSEVAAKLKLGVDLLASGDIAAARTMFERVAEAGEAAGAFSLAETYDPAVLGTLRLRGAIKADPALAQRWYEKARSMGSPAAADRIARLTQKPGR